jgi:hypothetical protein
MMLLAVFLAMGCTEPHYTSGHLQCATSGRACPDDFYCGADMLCWQNGTGPEMGTVDLAGADLYGLDFAGLDFAQPDLAGADLAGLDLQMPDLATPHDLNGVDQLGQPSLCTGLNVMVCDGFEEASINARWTQDTSHGTLTVDNTRAYRGTNSLHVHTDVISSTVDDPRAVIVTYQNFSTLPAGQVYVRAYVYIKSPIPTTFNQLLNFSDSVSTNGIAAGTASGTGHTVINDYTHGGWGESGSTLPLDQWFCMQFDAPVMMSGTAHIAINGTLVPGGDLAVPNSPTAEPKFDHIYCGLDWSANVSSQVAGDIWLDEIIVDKNPTSCPE